MLFYEFRLPSEDELDLIGFYPQVSRFEEGYDKNEPNSIYNVKFSEFPSSKPNLDYLVMADDAIATDILSFFPSGIYFFLNEKAKRVLDAYNLPEHKFYSSRIRFKNLTYDNYNLFYFISNGIKYIDFNKSLFAVWTLFPYAPGEPFRIKDETELIEVNKKCKPGVNMLRLYELVVYDKIVKEDFFDFGFLSTKTYGSVRLGEAFIKDTITGVTLEEVDYIKLSSSLSS